MSFPKDFRWGVATAAHQIEGGNVHSDWWQWEQVPGHIARGEDSSIACDHWNRVEQDCKLIKKLGVDTYRLSIEWARIEPRQGEFDAVAAAHYQNEIELLWSEGVEPMVTLHHFVSPQWFTQSGGWSRVDAPELFLRYVEYLYSFIGDKVNLWVTLNEPMVLLAGGYVEGCIPPGKKDFSVGTPMRSLLLAHAKAYRFLHQKASEQSRKIMVGIAHHLTIMRPYCRLNPLGHLASYYAHKNFNLAPLKALLNGTIDLHFPTKLRYREVLPELVGTQDFIGVNYYTRNTLLLKPWNREKPIDLYFNKNHPLANDLGWEFYPEGFLKILRLVKDLYPDTPVMITENGTADAKDRLRARHIQEHLHQLEKALDEGIDIRGYYHWSLMDNYEWIEGYEPRFGLYEVNYTNQERKLRDSGKLYQQIISQNSLKGCSL